MYYSKYIMAIPERLTIENLPAAKFANNDYDFADLPDIFDTTTILQAVEEVPDSVFSHEEYDALGIASIELASAYTLGERSDEPDLTGALESLRIDIHAWKLDGSDVAPITPGLSELIRQSVQFERNKYRRMGRTLSAAIRARNDLYVTGTLEPDTIIDKHWTVLPFAAPLTDVLLRRQGNHFLFEPVVRGLDGREGLAPFAGPFRPYKIFGMSVIQAIPSYEKKSLMRVPVVEWTAAEIQAAKEDGLMPNPNGSLLPIRSN